MSFMNTKDKVLVSLGVLILLSVIFYISAGWISEITGFSVYGFDDVSVLTQCLNSKGLKLYYSDNCDDCNKQKELFGDNFKEINSLDCSFSDCSNFRDIPAWKFEDYVVYGYLDFRDLIDVSGC